MKKTRLVCIFVFGFWSISLAQQPALNAQQIDDITGLVMDQGWQLIKSNCIKCHSAQIIVQNSGTREVWKSRLVWMQQTQGLEQLSSTVENRILDYLAANYGQKTISRRAGIASSLLPPNPNDY